MFSLATKAKNIVYPFFNPKIVYGLILSVSAISCVYAHLYGNVALYEGQVQVVDVLWHCITSGILYWRLGKVDRLKRFWLTCGFKFLLWETEEYGNILDAYIRGYVWRQGMPLVYPDALWFIQIIARDTAMTLIAILIIHDYVNKDRRFLSFFVLGYAVRLLEFIPSINLSALLFPVWDLFFAQLFFSHYSLRVYLLYYFIVDIRKLYISSECKE